MPYRSLHPTATQLVRTCDEMLNTVRPDQIKTDQLLEKAGISKGSMYHHFEDLQDLIEITFVYRFSKWIDLIINDMASLISKVKTSEELKKALYKITQQTQKNSLAQIRIERAWIYSESNRNKRFQQRFSNEAERLTASIEDLVSEVINRGLFKKDLNPRVVAVFIQAYSLGYIVNDFILNPVSDNDWINFINSIIENMFINRTKA